MDISSKRHCGNCMILYLFHLIFKILFFFQVLYILTLKIIIDMHPVRSELVCSFAKMHHTHLSMRGWNGSFKATTVKLEEWFKASHQYNGKTMLLLLECVHNLRLHWIPIHFFGEVVCFLATIGYCTRTSKAVTQHKTLSVLN